jgi:hypothetical protein
MGRCKGHGRTLRSAACRLISCGTLFAAAVATVPQTAPADSLLDTLHGKGILTPSEYERLQGTELPPETRHELIDLLRLKGLLTEEESERLQPHAPVPAAAPPATPTPPSLVAVSPVATAPMPAAPGYLAGYDNGSYGRFSDPGAGAPNPNKHSNNAVLGRMQLEF